ncbi:hypothetical protein M7I_3792 [Glarea lozoyensis 74030]|uniref:Uncharacterized protein n=1 Tax=Glarea lozoyensis (strain ATCC 74030 / MF5533) TaxID=1104152 RepID=H0EMF6_GLAL7|nr:hypothetical protein M7I_3792 [Glarea lozoyensis 74030]
MNTEVATKIAEEAEALATQLSKSIAELQQRREEADKIHDLLITRIETSAEQILFLEYHIAEMEDDYEANQSELQFLRIQLQAIQTQYNELLPQNRDEELSESIRNWKIDWEDIDRRSKARRKRGQDSNERMETGKDVDKITIMTNEN